MDLKRLLRMKRPVAASPAAVAEAEAEREAAAERLTSAHAEDGRR